MNRTPRQLTVTALIVLATTVILWPTVEAACDVVVMHRRFSDAILLAILGAPGHTELPLLLFWLELFGPICIAATAVLWKRAMRSMAVVSAIAGALVAPIQWSMANRAYGGELPNCVSDVPGFPATCGLPAQYRLTFAIAGAVAGLVIGWAITRGAPARAAGAEPAETTVARSL